MPNPISTTIFENEESVNSEKGFNNDILFEPSNDFGDGSGLWKRANCEKVYAGQNNTYIVLGRDRPGLLSSGYGGKGHEKAGAIDIVVGRLSGVNATTLTGKRVGNSIPADAARIYLSQKTDVDVNFRLPAGRTSVSDVIANSAIALKADEIRVVARNTMKLVTGVDVFLSNNNRRMQKTGVQLIADNNEFEQDMQPIPKGRNLEDALNGLMEKVIELGSILNEFMLIQKKFNDVVSGHVHHINPLEFPFVSTFGTDAPFPQVKETLPIEGKNASWNMYNKVEQRINLHKNNLAAWRTKFLVASSVQYINSSFHYLN